MNKLTTNKRWLLWLPLLGLALWLGLFADKTPNDLVEPSKQLTTGVHKVSKQAVPSPLLGKTDFMSLEPLIDRLDLIGADESKSTKSVKWRNLFVSSSWTPPAKPLPPAPVAVPTAPAFPFQYVGKKLEDSIWEVYLSRADKNFLVREGGTLEGTYHIDSITPQRLTVTYLPLGQSQSLSIGESQ